MRNPLRAVDVSRSDSEDPKEARVHPCGDGLAAVAMSSGQQSKERWFSNHRPYNRGGAAKLYVFDVPWIAGNQPIEVWRLRRGGCSVVGKPPLLGPRLVSPRIRCRVFRLWALRTSV